MAQGRKGARHVLTVTNIHKSVCNVPGMEEQLGDKARKVGKFQVLQGLGEHGKRPGVSAMVIMLEPEAHLQSMTIPLCSFSRDINPCPQF